VGLFFNVGKTFLAKKSHSHPDEFIFVFLLKELAVRLPVLINA